MIKQTLQADQLSAMRAKDSLTLETIRYILAQIKNKEIDKHAPLTEEEVIQVLRRQLKEVDESLEAYRNAQRTALVEEHEKKRAIIAQYMPPELSDSELATAIERIRSEHAEEIAQTPKALIGICMRELRSKADPKRIMAALAG